MLKTLDLLLGRPSLPRYVVGQEADPVIDTVAADRDHIPDRDEDVEEGIVAIIHGVDCRD